HCRRKVRSSFYLLEVLKALSL
ncbi:glycosyl hydrolases 18 family protein, partial [Vibrio parahaemolyticus V-223/04]